MWTVKDDKFVARWVKGQDENSVDTSIGQRRNLSSQQQMGLNPVWSSVFFPVPSSQQTFHLYHLQVYVNIPDWPVHLVL